MTAAEVRAQILRALHLPRLALIPLEALGDLTLGATAGPDRIEAELRLAVLR